MTTFDSRSIPSRTPSETTPPVRAVTTTNAATGPQPPVNAANVVSSPASARETSDRERLDVSIVSALAVTLDTNYSRDIYELRSVRAEHGEDYPDEVLEWIDHLVVRLQQIDVGRQYLKTLYMQDELSKLSRSLLYVGVPALLTAVVMLRAFAAGFQSFTALQLLAVVPLAVTVGMAPLLVLFAYVLRLTTVARRTLAITPFTMAMGGGETILDEDA